MIGYLVKKIQDIVDDIIIKLFGGETYEKIKIE